MHILNLVPSKKCSYQEISNDLFLNIIDESLFRPLPYVYDKDYSI